MDLQNHLSSFYLTPRQNVSNYMVRVEAGMWKSLQWRSAELNKAGEHGEETANYGKNNGRFAKSLVEGVLREEQEEEVRKFGMVDCVFSVVLVVVVRTTLDVFSIP